MKTVKITKKGTNGKGRSVVIKKAKILQLRPAKAGSKTAGYLVRK